MSDFLKDIIKDTGNEYATLAKDGVAGGDVDSFIDTGSYSPMLYYQVQFMVVYQTIVSRQLPVKLRQVKHSSH